jgi:hypothetical protein
MEATLQTTITCPTCGYQKQEEMATDACQYFYQCEKCKCVIRPMDRDCCVFCSYGSVKCPPKQQDNDCC